jgi:hypothetical protein
MSESREWDWPPTVPPEEPARHHHHVEITVRHHRQRAPHFLPVFLAIVAVLVLWRLKFGIFGDRRVRLDEAIAVRLGPFRPAGVGFHISDKSS